MKLNFNENQFSRTHWLRRFLGHLHRWYHEQNSRHSISPLAQPMLSHRFANPGSNSTFVRSVLSFSLFKIWTFFSFLFYFHFYFHTFVTKMYFSMAIRKWSSLVRVACLLLRTLRTYHNTIYYLVTVEKEKKLRIGVKFNMNENEARWTQSQESSMKKLPSILKGQMEMTKCEIAMRGEQKSRNITAQHTVNIHTLTRAICVYVRA